MTSLGPGRDGFLADMKANRPSGAAMLCHAFRTIFVHVPKTAGQSIEMVFLKKLNLAWQQRAPLLLRPNSDPAMGPPRLAHLYASEYVSCGHVSGGDFSRYFKFTVVRNPWARAVSVYKFAYQGRLDFASFLGDVVACRHDVVEKRHLDAQLSFLVAADGRFLVDRVLRFESLASEFAEVSRRIFGEDIHLPRVNAARDPTPYRDFYDEAGRALIAEKYRDDIEAFGYQFDDGG